MILKISFKLICISFILFLINPKVQSQTLLDSLYEELNSNKTIETKLKFLKTASYQLLYTNPDTVVYYSNYALRLCEKTGNLNDKADFLGILGEAHQRLSNYSESLNYIFEACKLCEKLKDSSELANNYNIIGNIYRVTNKLEESSSYYFKALSMREAIKDSVGIASSYNNIGIVYMMKSEYDTGMAYWDNSLKMKLAIGDSIGASTTMSNMAMYYRDIGETEKALNFFNNAIRIKKAANDYSGVSMGYQNLGELYIKQNDYKKGLHYYYLSLEQAKISKNKQLISFLYQILAETYYKHGDFKLAYDNYLQHIAIKDSVFNEKTVKNLDEIESKYENEKKAILIKSLEKEKIAQNEKQTFIILLSGIGFAAMFIIILIVFKNYRQKKTDHAIISNQKNVLYEKNREITDSIAYAKRLQEAILPPESLIEKILPNSYIVFQPKDVVSGDFYWLESIDDQHVIFAVADCTGHGVPGAMVSVVCSNALNRAVKEFKLSEPSKVLDKVRQLVIETFEKSVEDVKDGMDISLCLLNRTTNQLKFSGANNPLWILRKDQQEMEEIKADKQPIGMYHDNEIPFTNHEIALKEGDSIYLFSDGFADQFGGEKGKKLKYKPFKNLLVSIRELDLITQREVLIAEFRKWKGEMEQIDDVCIMSVKI